MKPRNHGAVDEARAAALEAEQDRNRRFVEAVGDAEQVPLDLAREFGLTGREAAHIVNTSRSGSTAMRARLFGPQDRK